MAEPVPKFRGRITNGLFLPEEGLRRKQYLSYLISKEGQEVEYIIQKPTDPKSGAQLRYFHGVVVKIAAEVLGYTALEMKEVLKAELLEPSCVMGFSDTVDAYKSIADMTKPELSRFIDDSIILLAKHGVKIPLPEEVNY